MAEIDPVVLKLIADNREYTSNLIATTKRAEALLRKQERDVKRLEAQIKASSANIGDTFRGLGATLAAGFSVQAAFASIDAYTKLQNQLRIAGLEGAALEKQQERLLDIANRYGVSIGGLGELFGRTSSAARDFGASQKQVETAVAAAAAAQKIQGSSSAQAAGALLGLQQAFGSVRVQAEEFNQIQDGLRPLLVAAAGASDEYGGSISRLRQAIEDGQLSGQRFFELVGIAAPGLLKNAETSAQTLSGAFQVLQNNFEQYIGEASKTSGVTRAISAAIEALGGNIGNLANALAVIGVVAFSRFAGSALAAGVATRAIAAHIAVATTSLAGLSLAANSAVGALLAALGGPVGIAVTALAAGIIFLATQESELEAETRNLAEGQAIAFAQTEKLRAATERLSSAKGAARAAALAEAQAEAVATAEKIKGAIATRNLIAAELARAKAFRSSIVPDGSKPIDRNLLLNSGPNFGALVGATDKNVADIKARQSKNEAEITGLQKALDDANNVIAPPRVAVTKIAGANSGSSRARSSGTGASAGGGRSRADIDEQFQTELRRLRAEELQNELQVSVESDKRLSVQKELNAIEYQDRLAQIRNNADYTARQKQALEEQLKTIFGVSDDGVRASNLRLAQVEQERQNVLRDEVSLLETRFNAEREGLQNEADLTDSNDRRRAIGLELVDLEERFLQAKYDALLTQTDLTELQRQQLQLERNSQLANAQANRTRTERENESPLEKYRREVAGIGNNLDDEFEKIQVNGLMSLIDGIANARLSVKRLGEVFKNVANSIISDLVRIAVQQAIVNSLGGAGGGLFGNIGSVFGGGGFNGGIGGGIAGARMSGGPVTAGNVYRVNEGGIKEFFQPLVNGRVVTPAQARAQSTGGQMQRAEVMITAVEDGRFNFRVQQIAGEVSIRNIQNAAPEIASAGAQIAINESQRPFL